jgi:hypothetical protein
VRQFIGKDRSNECCIRAQIANDKSKIPKLYSEFVVLFRMAPRGGQSTSRKNNNSKVGFSVIPLRPKDSLQFCPIVKPQRRVTASSLVTGQRRRHSCIPLLKPIESFEAPHQAALTVEPNAGTGQCGSRPISLVLSVGRLLK